jgi:hypothetical protein
MFITSCRISNNQDNGADQRFKVEHFREVRIENQKTHQLIKQRSNTISNNAYLKIEKVNVFATGVDFKTSFKDFEESLMYHDEKFSDIRTDKVTASYTCAPGARKSVYVPVFEAPGVRIVYDNLIFDDSDAIQYQKEHEIRITLSVRSFSWNDPAVCNRVAHNSGATGLKSSFPQLDPGKISDGIH